MHPQSSVGTVGWFQSFFHAKHSGSVFALSFSLLLAACGGGNSVTDNELVDPGADGVAPTLTSVTLSNADTASKYAALGETVRLTMIASESLLKPTVMINGVIAPINASMSGQNKWVAQRAMGATDSDGMVTFEITFTDVSGEVGVSVTDSVLPAGEEEKAAAWLSVEYCADGSCVVTVTDTKTIDFEDPTQVYVWSDIGPDVMPGDTVLMADPDDALNTVAFSTREGAGDPWNGTYFIAMVDQILAIFQLSRNHKKQIFPFIYPNTFSNRSRFAS